MLHFSKFKVTLILAVLIIGTLLAIPNLINRATLDALPGWVPKSTVNLGLDLQGGSHLLLEVDMSKLVQERLDTALEETRSKLRTAKIGYTGLVRTNDGVKVDIAGDAAVDQARKELQAVVGEGMELEADGNTLTLHFTEAGLKQLRARTVEQSIEIVRRRIDETGTREPTIVRQGEDRIVVQVPGVSDPQKIKEVTDIWTFSRDISTSRARQDPNWRLVATQASN